MDVLEDCLEEAGASRQNNPVSLDTLVLTMSKYPSSVNNFIKLGSFIFLILLLGKYR